MLRLLEFVTVVRGRVLDAVFFVPITALHIMSLQCIGSSYTCGVGMFCLHSHFCRLRPSKADQYAAGLRFRVTGIPEFPVDDVLWWGGPCTGYLHSTTCQCTGTCHRNGHLPTGVWVILVNCQLYEKLFKISGQVVVGLFKN